MKNKCHLGQKTVGEKEKLLVSSNFSFSHNVFHSYISFVRQNVVLCGNGFNRSNNKRSELLFVIENLWKEVT